MGKSAGKPPDYQGLARQQAESSAANVNAQTMANRPNQTTPFGSTNWTQGPDGQWSQNTSLAGGLGDAANAYGTQAGQAAANPLNPMLFGPIAGGDAARAQAIDAAFGEASKGIGRQFDMQANTLDAQLANSGLDPNSQAYRNAKQQLGFQRTDALNSAMSGAIGQGTAAGNQVFQNNAMAHQMAIADALTQRRAPIELLGQLQGFGQMPGFQGAGQAATQDYLGAGTADYNSRLQNAQQQNQMWGDLAGGIMGLGGSFVGLSDARAKQNIERLPVEALPGVPFARWEWKGSSGPRVLGVIAQDLQRVAPEWVHTGPDGLLRVDYSFLEASP